MEDAVDLVDIEWRVCERKVWSTCSFDGFGSEYWGVSDVCDVRIEYGRATSNVWLSGTVDSVRQQANCPVSIYLGIFAKYFAIPTW